MKPQAKEAVREPPRSCHDNEAISAISLRVDREPEKQASTKLIPSLV